MSQVVPVQENLMDKVKIPKWKRAVIKVGSALVAPKGKKCSTKHVLPIANFIIESLNEKKEIILVSSGAVAAGLSTQRHMRKKFREQFRKNRPWQLLDKRY